MVECTDTNKYDTLVYRDAEFGEGPEWQCEDPAKGCCPDHFGGAQTSGAPTSAPTTSQQETCREGHDCVVCKYCNEMEWHNL